MDVLKSVLAFKRTTAGPKKVGSLEIYCTQQLRDLAEKGNLALCLVFKTCFMTGMRGGGEFPQF